MLYDPGDPRQARVDSPSSAAGATLAGAAFLVIGAVRASLLGAGRSLARGRSRSSDALPAVIHS